MRQNLGYGRRGTDEALRAFAEKMRLMCEDERYAAKKEKREVNHNFLIDKNRQLSLNMEKKFKIHDKRGLL